MTEPGTVTSPERTPLPDLVLYGKPGCHLCDETRIVVEGLLAHRAGAGAPIPSLVDRDIRSDPGWERAYLESIPVLELGADRLLLAVNPAQIRAFLDEVLG